MYVLMRIIAKELLQLWRDKKMIPIIFVAPAVQIIALGYAANLDVTDVRTVLVDQDRTVASRALTDRFTASGYFELVGGEERLDLTEARFVEGTDLLPVLVSRDHRGTHGGGVRVAVEGGTHRLEELPVLGEERLDRRPGLLPDLLHLCLLLLREAQVLRERIRTHRATMAATMHARSAEWGLCGRRGRDPQRAQGSQDESRNECFLHDRSSWKTVASTATVPE